MVWALSLSTMKLLSHSLSPMLNHNGIRSLTGFGSLVRPLAQSVLYPRQETHKAIPKYVSRRTSYHLV